MVIPFCTHTTVRKLLSDRLRSVASDDVCVSVQQYLPLEGAGYIAADLVATDVRSSDIREIFCVVTDPGQLEEAILLWAPYDVDVPLTFVVPHDVRSGARSMLAELGVAAQVGTHRAKGERYDFEIPGW